MSPQFQIKKATKSSTKLRMAIFGPSGSGKTMSALRIAHGMGNQVGVIDTERGSASKYSDRYPFDVIELEDGNIEAYVGAMTAFAEANYDVLVVDSISHAWDWLLDLVDKLGRTKYKGNKFRAWGDATPIQQQLVDAILSYPGHVIATMRSKTEYVVEENDRGKSAPRRVGTTPRQRDGVEYEFDVLLEMDAEANTGRFIKDRTGKFQDRIVEKPDEALGKELMAWLSDGVEVEAPRPSRNTQSVRKEPPPQADDEFPPEPPADLFDNAKPEPPAGSATTAQVGKLKARLKFAGFEDTEKDRKRGHEFLLWLLIRGQNKEGTKLPVRSALDSTKDLSKVEASYLLDILTVDDVCQQAAETWDMESKGVAA